MKTMESSFEHSKDPVEKLRQLKSFLPTTVIYFIVTFTIGVQSREMPLWSIMLAKIFPMIVLTRFVLRQHNSSLTMTWRCTFCRFVFLGLIFSLLGDSLLVYQNVDDIYFMTGMLSFMTGHALYICAFGWKPFGLKLLVKLTVLAVVVYWYLWQGGLYKQSLPIKLGVAVYTVLNGGMNWRSWARLSIQDFKEGRWYEFFGCLGAINFLVSDTLLAANKFVNPLPYENLLIMGTYYLAQLGIALSVVDGPDTYNVNVEREENGSNKRD